jgi:non-ribosomal peptide synthetase component F
VSTGLYCYALTRRLEPDALTGCPGIGEAPLRLVGGDSLAAVVSEVDLEEFGEEGLRRNLEDLAWLEMVATAHDRVTRHLAEQAATAPLRLATVFLGEESLRAQLGHWHERATRTLDRIEGREEWSVKAYADPAAVTASDEEPTSVAEDMGAGKAYLLKRRAATQQREARAQADAELATRMHETLARAAVAGRRLAPQDRRLTHHVGEMILNGTYLLERDQVAAFKQTVEGLGGDHAHVRVELAGPWPPYSFASLDES